MFILFLVSADFYLLSTDLIFFTYPQELQDKPNLMLYTLKALWLQNF